LKNIFYHILFSLCLFVPNAVCALEPGDIAKDFALRDKNGSIVTLNSLRAGAEATVLELVSIYCDACRKKVPRINALLNKYEKDKVRVIAVALANEQPEIETETAHWNAQYPILPDPEKTTLYLYGAHNVPQIYVIDRNGIIRFSGNADDLSEIERIIQKLLSGKASRAQEGDEAPEIRLHDMNGTPVRLDFTRHSAGTILGFFSEDNRKSRRRAKFLRDLSKALEDTPAAVYVLVPDSFNGDLQDMASSLGERVPLLLDHDAAVFRQYAVTDPSEIVIVSGSGRVMKRACPQDEGYILRLVRRPAAAASALDLQDLMHASLKRALPDALSIKPFSVADTTIYVATHADGSKSYARTVHKDILCEVCSDIAFVQIIDQDGLYKAFEIVLPFESYGRQMDATAFLRQFIGKSYHQPFVAGANADIVTGATKSSVKFIEALNENEKIFSQFIDDPSFDSTFRLKVCFLEQAEIEHAMLLYTREQRTAPRSIEEVARYCENAVLPQCPAGGSYILTTFNDIPRVLCTVHGLDPQSSMIH